MESVCLGLLFGWLGADAVGLTSWNATESMRAAREMRRAAAWYRWLYAWIDPVAKAFQTCWPSLVEHIDLEQRILLNDGWLAQERLALWTTRGLITGAGALGLLVARGSVDVVDLLFAAGFTTATAIAVQAVQFLLVTRAGRRSFRGRLPTALELMALIVEAGGGDIMAAWATVAKEHRHELLGRHLFSVLDDFHNGLSISDALQRWADLTRESDVVELVLLLRTSLERGTPLHSSLRSLADQARLRRIQRLEQSAAAAKVHITWPGFVMMVACLMIACAPLILTALEMFK
ncbi:MAG: type II secretion system F family protein [Candidatus Saccharimonas sp.]|nr:type II secretion system F family protein [Planctomycetaceae bacterium]